MEPSIAGMVLLSAVLHPIWNALIKGDARPDMAFMALMAMFLFFAGAHGLATGADFLSVSEAWPLVLISSAGLAIYGYNLVLTLKQGDLSAYYPIVRSSPLFIVLVGVLFLDARYTPSLLAGMALVVGGAIALQYRPGSRFFDDPATLLRALAAMVGSGVYSISDSRGVRLVEPMVFMFWVQIVVIPILGALFFRHRGSARMFAGWRPGALRYLTLGSVCYGSYILVLFAYRLGGEVAAVTTIRQASIPLSVVLGGFFFKEGGIWRRLVASGVLAAGIIVIVLAP